IGGKRKKAIGKKGASGHAPGYRQDKNEEENGADNTPPIASKAAQEQFPAQPEEPAQVMILVSCADHVEEDILQRCILFAPLCCPPTRSLTQLLQCSLGDQHPLIDDAYPRAEAFDHLHDMRREEDGSAVPRQFVQDIANSARADRIDTFKGFI